METLQTWIRLAIREAIFGMEDGMVSTAGALTGIAAGGADSHMLVLAGSVIVSVEALSMSAGSYLSAQAHRQLMERLLNEEKETIRRDPEGERLEIRHMYTQRGYSEDEIALIERRLMSDQALLLEDMAHKELGIIPAAMEKPQANAIIMMAAYALGGMIPLTSYLFLSPMAALPLSLAASAAGLFGLGAVKGHIVHQPPGRSGLGMLLIGGLACGLGFLIGKLAGV